MGWSSGILFNELNICLLHVYYRPEIVYELKFLPNLKFYYETEFYFAQVGLNRTSYAVQNSNEATILVGISIILINVKINYSPSLPWVTFATCYKVGANSSLLTWILLLFHVRHVGFLFAQEKQKLTEFTVLGQETEGFQVHFLRGGKCKIKWKIVPTSNIWAVSPPPDSGVHPVPMCRAPRFYFMILVLKWSP